MSAIGDGDVETVERLVAVRPDLGRVRDASGASAIQIAAYHGQPEIAVLLAEAAGEIDLVEAVVLGEPNEVARRLDAGESADSRSRDGFPLLGLAAFFGHRPIVEMLLAYGADPNLAAQNAMAVRPLNSAVAVRDPEARRAIVTSLLAAGADANPRQAGGWTPLHQAAATGDEIVVSALLDAGAKHDALSDDDRTPADLAAERGHPDLAARLRVPDRDSTSGDP